MCICRMSWASTILVEDNDSPNTFSHAITHEVPPGDSRISPAIKLSEEIATANIHVARMKKGLSLDLMSGERSGNTTVPNRSTAIRIRFCIETKRETLPKKKTSLHKAWPSWPPISKELVCTSDRFKGIQNIADRISEKAMFAMK